MQTSGPSSANTDRAAKWDERYGQAELVWSAGPNEFARERIQGLEPGRALDVACGEARNALWLAEQGWDVVGFDFSAVAIEKARRIAGHRNLTSVDFRVMSVEQMDASLGSFDLIVVAYLQIPADELQATFERAVPLLAPGGRFLVVAHHVDNLEHGYGGPPDRAVLQSPEQIAGWLDELDIEEARAVERQVQTDEGPRTAIDALVMARRIA